MKRKRLLILLFVLLLATGCLPNIPAMSMDDTQRTPVVQPRDTPPVVRPGEPPHSDRVEPGDTSLIYAVQPGDTLSQIAAKHGTTVAELVTLNSDRYPSLATNPSLIHIGWELRLPGATLPTSKMQVSVSTQVEEPSPATPTAEAVKAIETFDPAEAEGEIVGLVNQDRAQAGLGPLVIDATLTEIARQRSEDMIARNYFSHYDPETGKSLAKKLFDEQGYTNYTAAENIGLLQNEAESVPAHLTIAVRYDAHEIAQQFVKGWLQSPKHREHIFHAEFNKTGVGIVVSPDGRKVVATQIFQD